MIGWKPFSWDSNTASARLRCFVPCAQLKQAGWPCELFEISRLNDYKLVVFQKAYTTEDIGLARQLKARKAKIVFDLCDNHFYRMTHQPNRAEELHRLEQMVELADMVSVSTSELAKLIPQKTTAVIDDAMEDFSENGLRNFFIRKFGLWHHRFSKCVRLVWFGTAGSEDPPFGLINLAAIVSELNELNVSMPVSLTVLSNSKDKFEKQIRDVKFPVRFYKWNRDSFRAIFQQHDVCLLPISKNPFTVCKTNNRLLLSLRLGIPVVADKIPSYEEFSGFVPFGDWQKNIRAYIENPESGRASVKNAQAYIQNKYHDKRTVQQWSDLLGSMLY
ncbi:MAG TPA: hypothetical protein VIK35_10880 [Verrucomicrobiae bacterium]